MQTVAGWFTAMAKFGNWQPQMFLGYIENLGAYKGILSKDVLGTAKDPLYEKNSASSLARMYRIQPEHLVSPRLSPADTSNYNI